MKQFNESTSVTTTHLDRIKISKRDALKVQKQFSITDQSTTMSTVLVGTVCKILLVNGTTKSFM